MRRVKLVGACIALIVLSLPLLPGPGAIGIAHAISALEREFAWVGRLLDMLAPSGAGNQRRLLGRRLVVDAARAAQQKPL